MKDIKEHNDVIYYLEDYLQSISNYENFTFDINYINDDFSAIEVQINKNININKVLNIVKKSFNNVIIDTYIINDYTFLLYLLDEKNIRNKKIGILKNKINN